MKNPDPEIIRWQQGGSYYCHKGYDIFYRRQGQGENLLLLHGYPYSSFEWKFIWDGLADQYNVLAIDLLGMGLSDKPQGYDYSFSDYAECICEMLRYLGIERLHILSHDLGAAVAQELLARQEQQQLPFAIESIAFSNSGLFIDRYRPRFIQRLLSQSPDCMGKIISYLLPRKKIEQSVKALFGKHTQPDNLLMDQLWTLLNFKKGKRISYLLGRLVFEKKWHQDRWIGAMQRTEIPICYICGPADPNSGLHMALQYDKIIPHPKIYLLSHAIGHWPHMEDAGGFMMQYQKFRNETMETHSNFTVFDAAKAFPKTNSLN